MSVMYDALWTAGELAVLAGMPAFAPSDAYPWLGQDRQIFQGFAESSTSYVTRLIQWLDLWRRAGSSTGLLLAMFGYVGPNQPETLTVMSDGASHYSVWDTYAAGANPFPVGQQNPTPPVHVLDAAYNWRWDSASQPYYSPWMYWRKWVILFSVAPNAPWAAPTKVWASGGTLTLGTRSDATYGKVYVNVGTPASSGANTSAWGDGTCWGWSGTAQQAASLTQLAKTWKSAGCWVPWIIVSYDSTMFDQTQAFGSAKLPDGTWGYWSKIVADATYGTKYVASRPACSTATFLAGTNDGPPGAVLGVG